MTDGAVASMAAAVLKPKLGALRDRLDPDATGGAPLLGVNGVVLIGHGSSGELAVKNAMRVGAEVVRNELVARIREAIAASG